MSGGDDFPRITTVAAYVIVVSLVVGTGLFLLPPVGATPPAYQVVLAAILLILWSLSHGLLGRLRMELAFIEAGILIVLAAYWTRFLVIHFGVLAAG
jgi:hypothetical protein